MFARQPAMTYADYLAFEHESEVKHEFVNGQAFAMAEEGENHTQGSRWQLVGAVFGKGGSLYLQSIDLVIALSAIYEDVEL